MQSHPLTLISPVRTGTGPGLFVRLRRFGARLLLWHERAVQRRHLRDLDTRALFDIGLSRADVLHECAKPFWRP